MLMKSGQQMNAIQSTRNIGNRHCVHSYGCPSPSHTWLNLPVRHSPRCQEQQKHCSLFFCRWWFIGWLVRLLCVGWALFYYCLSHSTGWLTGVYSSKHVSLCHPRFRHLCIWAGQVPEHVYYCLPRWWRWPRGDGSGTGQMNSHKRCEHFLRIVPFPVSRRIVCFWTTRKKSRARHVSWLWACGELFENPYASRDKRGTRNVRKYKVKRGRHSNGEKMLVGWLAGWKVCQKARPVAGVASEALQQQRQKLTELYKFQGSRSLRIMKVDCMTFVCVCGAAGRVDTVDGTYWWWLRNS